MHDILFILTDIALKRCKMTNNLNFAMDDVDLCELCKKACRTSDAFDSNELQHAHLSYTMCEYIRAFNQAQVDSEKSMIVRCARNFFESTIQGDINFYLTNPTQYKTQLEYDQRMMKSYFSEK